MKQTLFNLTAYAQELLNKLMETADLETGEVDIDISNELSQVEEDIKVKAEQCAMVWRKLGMEIEQYANEIKRLKDIKEKLETNRDKLESYIEKNLTTAGIDKIDGMSAKISFRKSYKTIVDNLDTLPEEYIKVEKKAILTEIKKAIDKGIEIKGAHIETIQNLQIK